MRESYLTEDCWDVHGRFFRNSEGGWAGLGIREREAISGGRAWGKREVEECSAKTVHLFCEVVATAAGVHISFFALQSIISALLLLLTV